MLWRIFSFVVLEVYYLIICYSSSSANLFLSYLICRQWSFRHFPSDIHNVTGHVALAEHTGHQPTRRKYEGSSVDMFYNRAYIAWL